MKKRYNKAPKQGSVRCAHSAGRADNARPLARRYEYMRYILLVLLLLNSPNALACLCANRCLLSEYDIAAIVEIEKESSEYIQAYEARVITLKSLNERAKFEDGVLTKTLSHDISNFTIVEALVHKKNDDPSKFGPVFSNSCGLAYDVGDKWYFFGSQVEPGIFESSQCSCSIKLN